VTTIPHVIIVLSRCTASPGQTFGIRLEEKTSRHWFVNWAFALPETVAAREGYDRTEVSGSFEIVEHEYPGCPSCGQHGIALCGSCDKLGCWNVTERSSQCPWCGARGTIEGEITRLRAGDDI
jgi:hypothetical protein